MQVSGSTQVPRDAQARMEQAQQWFQSPAGQLLLEQEQAALLEELGRFFGGFMLSYGPSPEGPPNAPQIKHHVRIGPPLPGVQVYCEEQAWPLAEHGADVVVLQHALEFSHSPHALLREAAQAVRPGGHLVLVGINPWSTWGGRSWVTRQGLGQARCIGAKRLTDWLTLLGFALEKRRTGCYRPPLTSIDWQRRLAFLENWGPRLQLPGTGFYLLVARKLVVGLRPLRPAKREPLGKLLPMPVAKVSRPDQS